MRDTVWGTRNKDDFLYYFHRRPQIENRRPHTDFIGGHSEEDPPVPIPNTEVKYLEADDSA